MAATEATALSLDHIQSYHSAFEADPKNRLALDAVARNPVHEIALNHSVVVRSDHTFSHTLKTNEVTNQKKSGRCWLFAGLNLLRSEAMARLNLEKFELSQSYLMFWDKLEKANYFLENILATLDEPLDGRLLMFLLTQPLQDGGQWDMFVNLVKKYGVVPKSVMPETESSSNSALMRSLLTSRMREFAAELRRLHQEGANLDDLRERKLKMLSDVYRMLAIHLGEPPTQFFWQWRDKDEKFHRDGTLTPQEFFQRYASIDLDGRVCLIHCPTENKPFNKLYTIQYLGNVVEGGIIRYLNVALPVFKQAAVDAIVKDGQPVWFGCDVDKRKHTELGILDTELYDYSLLYGFQFKADKAQRVDYGDSEMTHAMVFTGVDLDANGRPTKWRVENSWGDAVGDKGYMVMSDAWFDEYMYEVVVPRDVVPPALLPVLEEPPVVLPPWDPMGALAVAE
jgi:bleomycin hydrolase